MDIRNDFIGKSHKSNHSPLPSLHTLLHYMRYAVFAKEVAHGVIGGLIGPVEPVEEALIPVVTQAEHLLAEDIETRNPEGLGKFARAAVIGEVKDNGYSYILSSSSQSTVYS